MRPTSIGKSNRLSELFSTGNTDESIGKQRGSRHPLRLDADETTRGKKAK
jgi:hypothetical protein